MQVTRRLAMPQRIQQIWDAIGSQGNQVMDFERLLTTASTMFKVPRDELNHELNHALKDYLVVSEVVETQRREETEIYKLPDASTMEKGDHDWYCFQCHLGGQIVKCEDCPRVYHLECLPEDRKPEKDLFVCPACHIMTHKPSAEKVSIKPKVLNQLLHYICERFKSWQINFLDKADAKTWAVAGNRLPKDAWRFGLLVYLPMDLEIMTTKAVNGKYVSLEEFQVDCETLVHAIGVYFGLDMLRGGNIGQAFLRDALHDIQEIKLCHDCFRRSNEKNHDWWFCLPCSTPHEVVWAKQTGYPYWPAKVMKKDGNKYDVRYFGGNYERGIIDAKNIQPIETSINQLKVRRTALWNDAFDELTKFQEIAKDPELATKLPPKGRGGPSSAKAKTGKRVASQSPEEVVTKKSRKSEPSSTPTPKTSRKSAASKAGTTTQANGTSSSTPASVGSPGKKKAGAANKSGTFNIGHFCIIL
ncbi:unnamed protein product [Orchesella dallaii]|uniref:Zinc finger MYND domain-containing protein 11 n=1 Tax=Orchesella dallaii TaxID=48710 RepID=A0ABP1RAB4_9HEXA